MPYHGGRKSSSDAPSLQSRSRSAQKDRYLLNRDGRFPYMEHEQHRSAPPAERDRRRSSVSPLPGRQARTPTSDRRHARKDSVLLVQNSPTCTPKYRNKSKDKLRPKIMGRVMSEIHSNLPNKNLDSEDFLHVLVDQVIAEVANEMNIYDEGTLIYPAIAQTSMIPHQSYGKSELLNQHLFEPSDTSVVQPKGADSQMSYQPPVSVTLTLVDDDADEEEEEEGRSSGVSGSQSEDDKSRHRKNAGNIPAGTTGGKLKKLLKSRSFWWAVFCILLTLYLLYVTMIFGAFLGLAICGPYPCSRYWQSPNPFIWSFLYRLHPREQMSNVHGLF